MTAAETGTVPVAETDTSQQRINDRIQSQRRGRGKYLIFTLDTKRYAVSLALVKEVIGMTEFTPVPGTPRFFKGLINLRGKIHSVIDLRCKLALTESPYQPKKTSIILTEIAGLIIGTIVDDVLEVVGFDIDQIQNELNISSTVSREYIIGAAKTTGHDLTLILDFTKVLSAEELALVRGKMAA